MITSNDIFDSELSKKPVSKVVKTNKMQIIDATTPGVQKPLIKSSTYVSKPLSADDIKKAKKAQSIVEGQTPKKPKKKVRWESDDKLVSIREFFKDETTVRNLISFKKNLFFF